MTFLISCLSLLSSVVSPNERVLQSSVLSFQIFVSVLTMTMTENSDSVLDTNVLGCTHISRGTITRLEGKRLCISEKYTYENIN